VTFLNKHKNWFVVFASVINYVFIAYFLERTSFEILLLCWIFLFGCFYYLVKNAGILFGSLVTYGIPIVAVVWGLIYGESLEPMQVVCLGVILLGVYIVNRGNLNFIPFLKQKSPQS
jgi:drug/metabolite transporter (DMT)-like permease